jgi:UDP-N-acetylmuramoylalanine--D-glutamate ligase
MAERIVILGGGESGVGAAVLAASKGYEVFLSDAGKMKDKYRETLQSHGIAFEEGTHTHDKLLNAAEVIKSPGIPDKAELIKKFRALNVPVISEIEFAGRFTDATIVGITGTNGKTTTTMLTYHLLKNGGLNVGCGGNVGNSFAQMVVEDQFDYYVLELSSFQLDGIIDFNPHIAVITNITPDHLDRYEYQFDNYIRSKLHISANQSAADHLIYGADSEALANAIKHSSIKAKIHPFSAFRAVEDGAYIENDNLIFNLKNKGFDMNIQDLALQGKHNAYNSMAAGIAARLLDIRKESIRQSLADFESIPHRMESVGRVRGIEFINDSKATNVNSAFFALESMKTPTIWIAGGVDKGNNYDELKEVVANHVKAIVVLGDGGEKIHAAFDDIVPVIYDATSMEEAVRVAYKLGIKGDTVLLSPACASFDLFQNYEDRGNQFKAWVKEL